MSDLKIIAAQPEHLPFVTQVYNHAVVHGTGTFETEALSVEVMTGRWQEKQQDGFPFLVALQGQEVVGFAHGGHFRARAAFRYTVEDSVYLSPNAAGKGIGKDLLQELIAQCRAQGFQQMLAVIGDSDNAASIGLHRACGFSHAGVLRDTGFKFERFLDTVLMQREL